jgi:hypothetical protein
MNGIEDRINVLKETIDIKKETIKGFQKSIDELCVHDDIANLESLIFFKNRDIYAYTICDHDKKSPLYIKTKIMIHYSKFFDCAINFKQNIIFDKYYDENDIEHNLNSIREQKFPELSDSQIKLMNDNTVFDGIIINFTYNVPSIMIDDFMLENKQYIVDDNYDHKSLKIPIIIPISF